MKSNKAVLMKTSVCLLVTCLSLFVPVQFTVSKQYAIQIYLTHAQAAIPQGWESYLDRPDILNVDASEHNLGGNWSNIKAAHFSFVAEVLELYSKDTHIYFLARDSEHLYDVARLATKDTADADRIHLLNVSRANMRDAYIKHYLAENGISEETLASGKKVLFVDTGFSGTIPRVVAEKFSATANTNLKTHLLVSSNPQHPSSRAFLVYLNPSINEVSPSSMHSSIVTYEHMDRYTDRSTKYVLSGNQYHPISPIGQANDGSVSKEKSLIHMRDLKAEWQKPETQKSFNQMREQFKKIKEILAQNDDKKINELKELLEKTKNTSEGRLIEAQIRDIFEAKTNAELSLNTSATQLNLTIYKDNSTQAASKKNELIKKFPEWASVLEDPDHSIPKLFADKNWQMIGNLIDANVDAEINKILANNLYKSEADGIFKSLQMNFIEKADPATMQNLAEYTFSQPHTQKMKDLLKLLIEKADPATMQYLARYTFSQPHTQEMTDLLKLLIEKGTPVTMQYLARYTFSQPHTQEMTDLLKLLIEKADPVTMQTLARYTFSQPHTQKMTDLLRLLIEKADPATIHNLAMDTFSQPHTQKMTDLLRLLIEKANPVIMQTLAMDTFSQPHTKEMKDPLKLLIEKADLATIHNLARYTFSQPHTTEMTDLLNLLIEKADPVTVLYLARYTFSQPHTNSPEHIILKKSLYISEPHLRKQFLETELAKINSPLVTKPMPALKSITAQLQEGDVVKVNNRLMKIIKKAGEGRRGVVFQVEAQDNKSVYALKTLKSLDAESLESLSKESSKALQWQQLKIPHSKILVQEKEYVLKTWIYGTSGEEVIQKYASGDQDYKPAADYIIKLVTKIMQQGAYVGDFRPANLIWNGKAWVIVDSGSIQQGMSFDEAYAKWSHTDQRGPKFERRWQLPVPKIIKCEALFL